MNTSDWIAIGSAGLAGWAVLYARSSARSGKDSAASARRSADEAARISTIETERWHDDHKPPSPGQIVAELRAGTPADSLWGKISVPHGYRVNADAYYDTGGSTLLSLPLLHPNQVYDLHIEQWPPGSTRPKVKEVRIRFWPPLDVDKIDAWTCPCGRPTGETTDGPGHWEWRVPVVYDPPVKPATAPAPSPPERRGGLFR